MSIPTICSFSENFVNHHKYLGLEEGDPVVGEVELLEVEALQHLVVVADQVDQVAVQVDHLKRLTLEIRTNNPIYLIANMKNFSFFQK